MAVWPSHYLPTTGDGFSIYPNEMQLPIVVDRTISASQVFYDFTASTPGLAEAVAGSIEQAYSGAINHFVDTNRRSVGAGNADVHGKNLDLPGLSLRYDNQFGRELLRVTVAPEAVNVPGGLQLDINNDGYVAFTLYDPRYPNVVNNKPGFPKSYDIYMNGYLIKRNFMVVGPCQTFVVMFGMTALRCQSLIDKNHLNPFENEVPPGLAPIVLPPRPKVNGDDDLFAYTLFDFTDQKNPVYDTTVESLMGGTSTVKTNITGALQFAEPTKSPLKTKKDEINHFGVTLSTAAGTQGTEDQIGYFIYAEFYARTTLRPVKQSWNKTTAQGGVIVANDKPLFWGNHNITSYTSLTPGENGMGFNLWAKQGGDDQISPVSSLSQLAKDGGSFQESISAKDNDLLLMYYQTVNQIITDFDRTQLPLIFAAQAKVVADGTKLSTDEVQLKKDERDVDDLISQLATYDDLIARGGDPVLYEVVIALDQAQLPIAKEKVVTAKQLVDDDITAFNAASIEFGDLIGQSPTLPPKPPLDGDDIGKFKYREITVAGDDFIFGDWQGG